MSTKTRVKNPTVIYQTKSGAIELRGDTGREVQKLLPESSAMNASSALCLI